MRNAKMNEVLDGIRSRVGEENLSNSCGRDGCQVSMEDVPSPRIIVDAERAFPAHEMSGKRCDYVIFFINASGDILFTVPIELKSGGVDASEVSEQLQRGADLAVRVAPKTFKSVCHPILFHGRSIHPKQRKTLNRSKVRFHDLHLTIKTTRCNRPKNLARALEDKG